MEEKCQNKGCQEPVKYFIYKFTPEGKVWLHVCKGCEGKIGDENMRLQGYDPRTGEEL